MTFEILWTFISKEWRVVGGAVLILGLYAFIYHNGYEASEKQIEKAKNEAALEEKTRSATALKTVQDDNIAQQNKNIQIQGKLDALVKKYNSVPCAITLDGVRELNELDK